MLSSRIVFFLWIFVDLLVELLKMQETINLFIILVQVQLIFPSFEL